ncbi:MAG: DUF1801 domain-containing protein [Phycisphaerales bacterium]|nr:DUF1801 domain-containing protein [Phycisphaerales bacterium]
MSAHPKTRAGSVDDYLAALTPPQRNTLETLRRAIKAAAPRAEECISYSLPAFRLDGRVLVHFGAAAKHCSFYPGSGATVAAHAQLLKDYDCSKGTIRFQPDAPLPGSLVRILVRARVDEIAASRGQREDAAPRQKRRQVR